MGTPGAAPPGAGPQCASPPGAAPPGAAPPGAVRIRQGAVARARCSAAPTPGRQLLELWWASCKRGQRGRAARWREVHPPCNNHTHLFICHTLPSLHPSSQGTPASALESGRALPPAALLRPCANNPPRRCSPCRASWRSFFPLPFICAARQDGGLPGTAACWASKAPAGPSSGLEAPGRHASVPGRVMNVSTACVVAAGP